MNRGGWIRRVGALPLLLLMTHAYCGESLNVMSFNIRNDNPADGANNWHQRKDNVAHLIRFYDASVVGVQEALVGQVEDLEKRLPGYAWYGVGRDDGGSAGEFVPIFYHEDRLKLIDSGTFWCSPTPDTPSKGWDAALPRIVSWVRFETRVKHELLVLNAHFDHRGEQARAECASLLRRQIDRLAGGALVIVTGDFNATPDSRPIRTMLADGEFSVPLSDASVVSELERYGPGSTHTSFDIASVGSDPIDYVFVGAGVEVSRFGVLSDSFDGRLPSDHYPVLATVRLPE